MRTNRKTTRGFLVSLLTVLVLLIGILPGEIWTAAAQANAVQEEVLPDETVQEDSIRTNYGTCYEVFVYSFYDSDGDGIGDLKGLTEKLDFINDGDEENETDLGCNMLWVMPVFPSPTYHKYDVLDYLDIDPQYGTLDDFDELLAQCHARGIRLILDLPLNHTSTEHPWFLQATDYIRSLDIDQEPSAEECSYVDYYNFSREPQTGYEPLEGSNWYYEARFWSGMPDLNLDNEAVRGEIEEIVSFWLDRGVDGFRLDAVTSYYTDDLNANVSFLAWLNETVKEKSPDGYLVGEAWEDQSVYAQYYRSGIDSLFDFAFAGAEGVITSVVKGRSASYYGEKLVKEEELFADNSASQSSIINAPFYTNHDMARSAGYYTKDDGSRVKLAQALNLLMPGNAFLYYGEELGMKGSGKDENKRAPMYWSADADAEGMCAGPPEMDEITMKFGSLEEQSEDPLSIYSYVRNAIHLKNRYPAIMYGNTQLLEELSGKEICAILREADGEETVLFVFNTSEESQTVDLSTSDCSGWELADMLCVSEETAGLENDTLYLPSFGIAVLVAP